MLVVLVHEIYEGDDDYPVVVHQFRGRSEAEARSMLAAHAETDAFLSAAVDEGEWDGTPLRVDEELLTEPD